MKHGLNTDFLTLEARWADATRASSVFHPCSIRSRGASHFLYAGHPVLINPLLQLGVGRRALIRQPFQRLSAGGKPLKAVARLRPPLPTALKHGVNERAVSTTVRQRRLLFQILRSAAAAREGGGARGGKSHPSNWSVHDGTARCLSARKARRGRSSPGTEPMGLNEDEPQLMSLVTVHNRSRRVPGAWTKADAGSADNRQPLSSPAGSAWQAR